jgi:hypothetical protein
MSETENTQLDAPRRGRPPTKADETVTMEAPVKRTKRVIIQRPYGTTDSHIFIGFNDYEKQVKFDTPVEMPSEAVDYLRAQTRAEARPDESGKMQITYSAALSIVDAPLN